jgi:hypothetical protein
MRHRISSTAAARLLASQMLLFGAAASPAAATLHHHHHTGALHHGVHGAISSPGSNPTGDPGTKGVQTKQDWKGDGNGSDERNGKSASRSGGNSGDHTGTDDHSGKSTGPKDNPIDTSITIVAPTEFVKPANAHGWKGFEIAHRLGKPSRTAKIWTPKSTIFTRSKTFTKSAARSRIIRNAIGQPLKRFIADPKGHRVKKDGLSAGDDTHRPNGPLAFGGTGDVASVPHQKPVDRLTWSLGRPHDPPANGTPYRIGLNGREMIHLGSGTAAIGGGANLNSGVLSGSSFHPKPR